MGVVVLPCTDKLDPQPAIFFETSFVRLSMMGTKTFDLYPLDGSSSEFVCAQISGSLSNY